MSKVSTVGYGYRGDPGLLLKGTIRAIEQMKLVIHEKSVSERSFKLAASEKMKWLTTNWPIKFEIEATHEGGQSTLVVRGGTLLTSITQEFNNQAKVQELVDLIKLNAPSREEDAGPHGSADIERMPCPQCGEMIAKTARVCRFCRTEL